MAGRKRVSRETTRDADADVSRETGADDATDAQVSDSHSPEKGHNGLDPFTIARRNGRVG